MKRQTRFVTLAVFVILVAVGCNQSKQQPPQPGKLRYKLSGPLIPEKMTMATAWDFPKNPLTDATLDDSKLSKDIKWGFQIFINTPKEAPQFTRGKMSCNNCHLNAGQKERSLPLVGLAGMFPEYNRRAGRLYSLTDRVVDCFLRSENATGMLEAGEDPAKLPSPTSREVLAVAAYLTWLSKGSEVGMNPTWRGQNTIASEKLIPVEKLDRERGHTLYMEHCSNCHGEKGQGVQIGDKKAGPLWGPDSWNDGAGAGRVYTLAGIIRYSMPYLNPGVLSDEDVLHIAAFINSQPRPAYPFKEKDYLVEKVPPDSVYYPKR